VRSLRREEGTKVTKGERREARRQKARYGMKVSGRSTKSVLLAVIAKKGREAAR
jgi:hypothetical protein